MYCSCRVTVQQMFSSSRVTVQPVYSSSRLNVQQECSADIQQLQGNCTADAQSIRQKLAAQCGVAAPGGDVNQFLMNQYTGSTFYSVSNIKTRVYMSCKASYQQLYCKKSCMGAVLLYFWFGVQRTIVLELAAWIEYIHTLWRPSLASPPRPASPTPPSPPPRGTRVRRGCRRPSAAGQYRSKKYPLIDQSFITNQ